MIPLAQRQTLLGLIQAARTSGARLAQACKIGRPEYAQRATLASP
ncbi:MAG: hypothetical protein U5L74_10185 [Ideonella sp.]|nr:hypothetical protein [Ideonella sp.]